MCFSHNMHSQRYVFAQQSVYFYKVSTWTCDLCLYYLLNMVSQAL